MSEGTPAEGTLSTLRDAYALMISKIKAHYPSAIIVCMTNLEDPKRDYSPGWPSNNRRGVSVEEWDKSILDLAESFGCITIDLQDCGITYDNAHSFTVDGGLHPNDAGMTLIAQKVLKEMTAVLQEEKTD